MKSVQNNTRHQYFLEVYKFSDSDERVAPISPEIDDEFFRKVVLQISRRHSFQALIYNSIMEVVMP